MCHTQLATIVVSLILASKSYNKLLISWQGLCQQQLSRSEEVESLALGMSSLGPSGDRKLTRKPRAHGMAKESVTTTRGGSSVYCNVSDLQSWPLPSLHSLCLGVLAIHLKELMEYGEHALPLLPSEAKLSLLAAARRREAAPLLRIFRFGGFVEKDPEAMSEAVLRILPVLEQTDAVVDSWEETFVEEELASGGGGGGCIRGSGRLMHLRCLIWPEMPYETKILCQNASPAVCFNPSREQLEKLPPTFNPEVELDGEYLKKVAGREKWRKLGQNSDESNTSTSTCAIHIAEKFRMAFESQEKRLKKKDKRLWRKATRDVLSVSGGERAIWEWEYGF